MRENVAEKNHNFLKIVSFVLGYVFLLGISVLSVYGVNDEASICREVLQGTLGKPDHSSGYICGRICNRCSNG